MKSILAALGLALVASTAVLPAYAAGPSPQQNERLSGEPSMRGGPGMPAGPGMHGRPGMERGPGMVGGPGRPDFRPGPRGEDRWSPQLRLASRLAAAETLVGIRASQLDAWRDYTSALLDLAAPPGPPPPPMPAADDAKAFAREERMIRAITERAAKAATLQQAITALRGVLSPDQLARLATVDLRLGPPRMGPDRGPGGPGPHHGRPGPGRDAGPPPPPGPMMMAPDNKPPAFEGPDEPDDLDLDLAPDAAPEIPDNINQPATAPRPG